MRSTASCIALSIAATTFFHGQQVAAQTTSALPPTVNNTTASKTAVPETTVQQAKNPDDTQSEALMPVGAKFGSFTFFPKLEAGLTYNDNIYALKNKTNDGIVRLSPSFDLQGDFGATTTDFRATVDRYQYFDNHSENRTDWSLGGNGQVEIVRDSFAYLAGGYSRNHEDRGDPNSNFSTRRPTSYDLTEAGGGFSSEATRLRYGFDLSYRGYDFNDSRLIGGGTLNNDDRDRKQYRIAGRLGFEFSPGYTILGRVSEESIDYSTHLDDNGFDRDSKGFRATLGVSFELTQLLTGELFAGYMRHSYDDARFKTLKRPVFGSSLSWTPTPLTTVTLIADRTVQETVALDYRGFVSTVVSLGVEHELLRTVTLNAKLRYGRDQYLRATVLGGVGRRSDDNYGGSAGVKYTLNRNVYTSLNYEWTKRASNVSFPGIEFDRNRLTAVVGVQF